MNEGGDGAWAVTPLRRHRRRRHCCGARSLVVAIVASVASVASVGVTPVAFAEGDEWVDPDGDGTYNPPTIAADTVEGEWTDPDGDGTYNPPTVAADTVEGEWTDPDGDGTYNPPTVAADTVEGEWTDPDGDGTYNPPTVAADPVEGEWTGQSAQVVVSDVAIANTGGNASDPSGVHGVTAPATPSSITTGSADAIGSVDRTTVDQQATADLADGATADVVQLAIVFNIGAAQATSGGNVVAGGAGPVGEVSTGDAMAIGNEGSVVVLQAASADSSGAPDGSVQEAITLRIGISVAGTGANGVGATGDGVTGAIVTGDAQAIGNDATTDVVQLAIATGSGTARLSVDQRAFVLNIGLALANTGGNGAPLDAAISAAANDFVDSPDEARATSLLSLLLPSLLAGSDVGVAGTGQVTTGDATAVGNRSTTLVDQSATVIATGDGTASVDQQVVVTNLGVAVADTGGNGGGAHAGATVDPSTTAAVASIAGFIGSLVRDLHQWDGSSELLGRGLTLDVGGRQIVLDGRLAGQLLSGDPDTPEGRRNIRQLSAIINLGIAVADSGSNTSDVDGTAPIVVLEPTAQAGVVSISTGDATAVNRSTVVVCQRDDRPDVACPTAPSDDPSEVAPSDVGALDGTDAPGAPHPAIAPATLSAGVGAAGGPSTTAVGSTDVGTVGSELPVTGGDPTVLATWAAVVLGIGVLTAAAAKRREARR